MLCGTRCQQPPNGVLEKRLNFAYVQREKSTATRCQVIKTLFPPLWSVPPHLLFDPVTTGNPALAFNGGVSSDPEAKIML